LTSDTKLQFEDNDLERIGDMLARSLARALVSAVRTLARDPILGAFLGRAAADQPATPAREAAQEPLPDAARPPAIPEPAVTAPPEPVSQRYAEQPYSLGARAAIRPLDLAARQPEAVPAHPAPRPRPAETPATKAPRRSLRQVCKTVAKRPGGYITTDDAVEILAGVRPDSAGQMIFQWIWAGEIAAVIVAEFRGKPTKGLPGRLMVDRKSVIARNTQRLANRAVAPRLRQTATKVDQHVAA
jgi:hypothetical protein